MCENVKDKMANQIDIVKRLRSDSSKNISPCIRPPSRKVNANCRRPIHSDSLLHDSVSISYMDNSSGNWPCRRCERVFRGFGAWDEDQTIERERLRQKKLREASRKLRQLPPYRTAFYAKECSQITAAEGQLVRYVYGKAHHLYKSTLYDPEIVCSDRLLSESTLVRRKARRASETNTVLTSEHLTDYGILETPLSDRLQRQVQQMSKQRNASRSRNVGGNRERRKGTEDLEEVKRGRRKGTENLEEVRRGQRKATENLEEVRRGRRKGNEDLEEVRRGRRKGNEDLEEVRRGQRKATEDSDEASIRRFYEQLKEKYGSGSVIESSGSLRESLSAKQATKLPSKDMKNMHPVLPSVRVLGVDGSSPKLHSV